MRVINNIKKLLRTLYERSYLIRGHRVVYLDCGANIGKVLELEVENYPYREYFAFEANPGLIDRLNLISHRFPESKIQIKNQAIWTENGTADFFLSGENERGVAVSDGSTLIRGKKPMHPKSGKIDYENPVLVETLDFSTWLSEQFEPTDYIILKMDIEGAEYAVLEKMLETQGIDRINRAIIEFHYHENGRVSSISKEMHAAIIDQVRCRTRLKHWH